MIASVQTRYGTYPVVPTGDGEYMVSIPADRPKPVEKPVKVQANMNRAARRQRKKKRKGYTR